MRRELTAACCLLLVVVAFAISPPVAMAIGAVGTQQATTNVGTDKDVGLFNQVQAFNVPAATNVSNDVINAATSATTMNNGPGSSLMDALPVSVNNGPIFAQNQPTNVPATRSAVIKCPILAAQYSFFGTNATKATGTMNDHNFACTRPASEGTGYSHGIVENGTSIAFIRAVTMKYIARASGYGQSG